MFNDLFSYCENIDIDNLIIITKFGKKNYTKANFNNNSVIIFGSEIDGLPKGFIDLHNSKTFKIPMVSGSRSLNLSNAVAIVVYEAWKNLNFSGAVL